MPSPAPPPLAPPAIGLVSAVSASLSSTLATITTNWKDGPPLASTNALAVLAVVLLMALFYYCSGEKRRPWFSRYQPLTEVATLRGDDMKAASSFERHAAAIGVLADAVNMLIEHDIASRPVMTSDARSRLQSVREALGAVKLELAKSGNGRSSLVSSSDLRAPAPAPPINSDAGAGLESPYYARTVRSPEGEQLLLIDESPGPGAARKPFRKAQASSRKWGGGSGH